MNEILKIIQERQSARVPFDPNRQISKDELKQILEAARWTPTAHNMQNFDVIIIDDKAVLERIGKINHASRRSSCGRTLISFPFLKRNS